MNDVLRQNWFNLLRAWDVDFSLANLSFEEIVQAYAEPGRFYHTLEHVADLLEIVKSLAQHARNLNAVKLAVWLHDVIHDSKAADNAEQSAAYALGLCNELAIPEGPSVAALILKTKTHDARGDADARVFLDADLAILGTWEADYLDYAEKIRREYAWAPEAEYRHQRRQILGRFLMRPRIYHFFGLLEEPARRNMAGEIARLSID